MRLKKMVMILTAILLVGLLSACSSKEADDKKQEDTKSEGTTETDTTILSKDNTMIVDKDKKEVKMLCEVNGTYFTEPTRHGIVFKGGSNGEKAILRGLVDEKEFYQGLIDIGGKAGNNLAAEDMKASEEDGTSVDGDKLTAVVTWDGQEEEIPFADIVKVEEKRTMDLRFGGNLASAEKNNTGCVLCLDSCATGIVSDAAWPTGTTQNDVMKFFGEDSVLPDDGTEVTVTFRLAQ